MSGLPCVSDILHKQFIHAMRRRLANVYRSEEAGIDIGCTRASGAAHETYAEIGEEETTGAGQPGCW